MSPRTCPNCGARLDHAERHCLACGQKVAKDPQENASISTEVPPPGTEVARPYKRWIGLGIVGVGALFSATLAWWLTSTSGGSTRPVTAASVTTTSPEDQSKTPSLTPTPTPTPTKTLRALASTPQEAMGLTTRQARSQLQTNRQQDRRELAAVRYAWIPQVSSKCEGLDNVDIKPAWMPDGRPDTNNLSPQQILAFHLSLSNDYGALMVTDNDVGDRMRLSVCGGNTMWMAVVPESFRSAAGANAWCDRNGFPAGECAARWVVRPGSSGAEVKWRT